MQSADKLPTEQPAMAGDVKWIEGVTGSTAIERAARLSLLARFKTVDESWKDALDEPRDPERIHRVRVATRRAGAALRVFDDLLARKPSEQLNKLLSKLRRAAGDARDEDVFAERLREWAKTRGDDERPGLDWLAGAEAAKRSATRLGICETDRLRSRWRTLIKELRPRANTTGETLADRAAEQIPRRLTTFHSAASANINRPELLHRLRIAGKRLRYALELLGPGIPAADQIGLSVQMAQDILGQAHDARTIADRLADQLALVDHASTADQIRFRPGIIAWKNHFESEAAAGPARFRDWYREWQDLLAATGLRLR
ncbi:MAG: CHAD domain-containing protein [Gemmataceae bacterium]